MKSNAADALAKVASDIADIEARLDKTRDQGIAKHGLDCVAAVYQQLHIAREALEQACKLLTSE